MIERLVALAVLAASAVYLVNGSSLVLGTTARPGPGFFPLGVGVFGAAVALAWVVTAFRRSPAAAGGAPIGDARARVVAGAALLIGFCLVLPWIGYPLSALLFTGVLLRALGGRWLSAGTIALASALASYYLFGAVLGVPLPRGVLFD